MEMLIPRRAEEEIKRLIVEGFCKEDIIEEIKKKYKVGRLSFFYDCCYNTVCKELGINRKKGEELKPKKVKIRFKK